MHNSYFFLRFLSAELNQRLMGWRLVSCFSQSKDELVIEFNNGTQSFFIKASLQSDFCCLSFPNSFNRARKNSIDLFPEVVLNLVESVTTFNNERSFAINFLEGMSLIFKMHGNRSNILVAKSDVISEIFRNHLTEDLNIVPSQLNRQLEWTQEATKLSSTELKKNFFTLGRHDWDYLNGQGLEKSGVAGRWKLIQNFKTELDKGDFYIIDKAGEIRLSLYPEGKILKQTKSAIESLSDFFLLRIQANALAIEKQKSLALIRERVKQVESYIAKNQPLLNSLNQDTHYQLWGDLLMANMHLIQKGHDHVTLQDFSEPEKSIDIKLKKDLSPQKNAEVFYRKARNQKIEIEKLTESIAEKQKQLGVLKAVQSKIELAASVQEIRGELDQSGLAKSKQESIVRLPYREVEFKGFIIRIGKSAADNDALTLKHTHKDDLWLHAKDVAGSHVVIKHLSGKDFPKDVVERAAELAAFHSKRKGEALAPVAYAQKKFVRKRKGDPPGAVIVEKEKVMMVEPRE